MQIYAAAESMLIYNCNKYSMSLCKFFNRIVAIELIILNNRTIVLNIVDLSDKRNWFDYYKNSSKYLLNKSPVLQYLYILIFV